MRESSDSVTLPGSAQAHARDRGPPGDKIGTEIIHNVFAAWRDPLSMMARVVAKHGDIAMVRFAWLRYYVVNDPDAVHHVLVENHRNYIKSRNYQGLKVMLGQGLLTSEGDHWRRQRKLAQPAFHRERLASFADEMSTCTTDMLERWSKDLERAQPSFDLHREMMRLTLRIVGRTLFGADLDGEAKAIGDALTVALAWSNEYVESVVRIPPWVPTPANFRFHRAKRTIDGLALRLIAERRAANNPGDDLLGMLMSARDESGGAMSDAQLKDELLTLVLAGHETTANALTFAFYLLSRHPDVGRKLAEEIDTVLSGRSVTLADLPKLSYTKAVVEETMRLYPPAWVIERQNIEEDRLLGYRIPKGSVIGICPYQLHRHPRLWANPEGFDPERFLGADPDSRPKHAYMPFGGGPRLCIGNAFAMMEMQIVLAAIVQRYRLELEPGFELALDPSVTLRPAAGMSMRLARR